MASEGVAGAPAGTRAGLLVVDLQRVFAEAGSPWRVPEFDRARDATLLLLEAWAAVSAPAVSTRFVADPDPDGSWRDYYAAYPFAQDPASTHLWDLVDEVATLGPVVVDAPTMGKWTPAVADALGHPDTVVVTGVATECCVLATVIAASDAGVRVRLVAEACAGGTAEDDAAALRVLGAFHPQVQVVSLDEALALL